jgi:2-polyprenyl-3-methyl-5-hydroxy-6-metoxy-1,4-benzoquinol methylase
MSDWTDHVAEWSRPPVDDVGYLSSADMMTMGDTQLLQTIMTMAHTRYNGWRNYAGLWREMLKLDDTHGKDVLDFGCGVGMEAFQLQEAGNRVSLADLSSTNLSLAYRVLRLGDHAPDVIDTYLVAGEAPYFNCEPSSFDAVHCSGVLHHIPWAREIMRRFHDVLRPGGEVRLMLYSDHGWKLAVNATDLPHRTAKAEQLPHFEKFVRYFDGVGQYTDFYSLEKLEHEFGALFNVSEVAYLTEDLRFLGAVLTRKGDLPEGKHE